MPGRRNYGKLSGNRCLQDRSSHMPPPAPLGTGDAQAEAAQSTNSCSRRHGKIVLFILLCCNRASPPQFIRTAFHAYNSSKKTNNSCRSSGCSGSSSCSGPFGCSGSSSCSGSSAALAPSAAPTPRAAPGSVSCSGSSSCSGLLWLCALLLLRALTI